MALANSSPRRYSLRTLVLVTIIGPPLLALAWWSANYFWHAAPDPLFALSRHLLLPGLVCTLGLVSFSLIYTPANPDECDGLKVWPALGLFCLEFIALWHWLGGIFQVVGWLFIWGDRGGPLMDLVVPAAAIIAATTAGLTTYRSMTAMATRTYYHVVMMLSVLLLVLAFPYGFWRLHRWLALGIP